MAPAQICTPEIVPLLGAATEAAKAAVMQPQHTNAIARMAMMINLREGRLSNIMILRR
jgi:hypothetical protein